jgi:isopenicillin-N N-acyltransferase-like protein
MRTRSRAVQPASLTGYDVIDVKGSSYERGFAYGEHHSDRLKRLLQSHYRYYSTYLNVSREEVLDEAIKYEGPVRDYSEEVAEELRGTAEGAGVKMSEVMLITAFNEVLYPKLGKNCTAFGARGSATSDGLTYIGQNNDEGVEPWLGGDCTTLTRHRQKDAPDALIYTYVGAPALMGINSAGLSVCINALVYKETQPGVPMLAVVRSVMNQKDIEGATREIERAKRAYSVNFVLGTPKEIVDLETYPDRILKSSSDSILWHANHCLFSEGLRYENDQYRANSVGRCDRMQQLLESKSGSLDRETLQSFLSDHESKPNSICWHVDPSKPPQKQTKTLDSMVYISEKREAWIAKGNPCSTEFVKYTV